MWEFKILKLIDKFKWVYEKLGVDYDMMSLILKMKLTTDSRKTPTVLSNNNDDKKEEKNQFKSALKYYLFLGIVFTFIIIPDINVMAKMSMYFSMIMFFILSIFISDFSTVILDVRDKTLIGTKGVDLRTINAAKFTHIIIYICEITLALCGFSLIASLRYGILFFIVFFVEIIFIDLFLVTITALVYYLVLKYFDGERLKDIINFIQIILTVIITIGYQFIGKLFNFENISGTYTAKMVHYFLPPLWFSAPLSIAKNKQLDIGISILAILAVVVPILSIILYFKTAKSFEEYLIKLNENSQISNKEKGKFTLKLSKFICKNKIERAFFNFSCEMLSKERDFKLKVYPSLAMAAIFPLIFLLMNIGNTSNAANSIHNISQGKSYFTFYALIMLASPMITMIQFSKEYKGGWIYKALPIENYNLIYKGSIKACIYKFIMPVVILDGIIYLLIFKWKFIIHLIIMIFVMILMILIDLKCIGVGLPFSMKYSPSENKKSLGAYMLSFIITGAIWGGHYISTTISYGIYVYLIIIFIATIISWNLTFKNKNNSKDIIS